VLVGRAGAAVARTALDMLGGGYGRRVVVIAGKGNNGADGRAAALRLQARGVRVEVVPPTVGSVPCPADLVIDAAFGTGLGRPYTPPRLAQPSPVLAVDIPSGLSGLTGLGTALPASRTVTFAALKPGLLAGEGRVLSGLVTVADIGLGSLAAASARTWLVEDRDVSLVPIRPLEAHKWQTAIEVVAGSPGMTGAPWLLSRAALRAGAGYVRLGIPGADLAHGQGPPPGEIVGVPLPATGWARDVLSSIERVRALVVGPGLGRQPASEVAHLVSGAPVPVVVDADGINAFPGVPELAAAVSSRSEPTVITPHAGEFARLTGAPPGDDRLAAVRSLAAAAGVVVLLKGSTTVVASPDGRVLLVTTGSARLATAGTGDVLSGVIGALLARGVPALEAAALGAHIHGRAASLGRVEGLIASDLPELVADWLSAFRSHP
jgi:NAD(P)H-hydrate epimerase